MYALLLFCPNCFVTDCRNKLTLRFGCGSCGSVAVRAVCGSCGLRSRFVRFAVAVCAICGCGSCNLRLRFVRFAVAVRAICGCGRPVFSPTAENYQVLCSDVFRLQRFIYAF